MIKNTVTNAAEITVLELIDNTLKTGGGPASVFGSVIEAPKGPVMKPIKVTSADWRSTFGKPFPLKYGTHAEGLRHVAEAADDAQGIVVVRVVASDFAVPSLSFNKDGSVSTGNHQYDDNVMAGADVNFILYPKDGDPSNNRKVELSWDTTKSRATLNLYQPDAANTDEIVETLIFGFDVEDMDDMGQSAYIEAVLGRSQYLTVDANAEIDTSSLVDVAKTNFEGGSLGGRPSTDDYIRAWDIFRNMRVQVNELFAAGNYDTTVIANMVKIADGRHIECRFDIPPGLNEEQAIAWQQAAGIQSRQASAYWAPYRAKDPFYGIDGSVWGVSGAACGAKARCNRIFTGEVPGVHYAPAGTKRGRINRRNVKAIYPNDLLDRDALYDNRINPIIANDNGPGVYIGDALTCHYLENYSRFNWVTAIDNYITHRFLQAASYAKFEPDGLTYEILSDLMKAIREDVITSGAVVKPRDPDEDGENPMTILIEQGQIDLWNVTWAFCPTGSTRRIVGQPKTVR